MAIALAGIHRDLRPYADYALELAADYGLRPTVTSVYRGWDEQAELYRRYLRCLYSGQFGRSAECAYPANAPGDSAHNYRLAWDSWVPDADMPLWVAIRRYVGWEVFNNDPIHAQYPNWRSVV